MNLPTTTTNGITTHYEVEGEGHPLVLIHGHTLNLRMWDDQVPAFAAKYKTIRYDIRGHGQSQVPNSGYTLLNYAQDLYDLLKHLGVDRAYLLGLSIGGSIALEFSLAQPEMVTALIMADTTLEGFTPSEDFHELIYRFSEAIRTKGVAVALEEAWFPRGIFDGVRDNPGAFDRIKDMARTFSGAMYLDETEYTVRERCQIDRLGEITIPTQIIVGANDIEGFRHIAHILRNNLSRYEKVKLPNCGHMSNMEQPKLFNWAVMDFLGKVEKAD